VGKALVEKILEYLSSTLVISSARTSRASAGYGGTKTKLLGL